MREYLQIRILSALQRYGAMIPLAFHGGTALRLLFHLPRYSEDLDFTLEHHKAEYNFHHLLNHVRSELTPEGYELSFKVNDRKTVQSAFVQFSGVLYESGLSPHPDEKMNIKIEIDTIPPEGVILRTTVIRQYFVLQVQHHDRSSMFAGKLHALMSRDYTKGRDLYDLFWYLSDRSWPAPNFELLNNALKQTGWNEAFLTQETWKEVLRNKIIDLDWEKAILDVRPFLEDEREVALLTMENLLNLIGEKN